MATEIHFHITKERADKIRVGDWRAMERGTLNVDKTLDLMSTFMVNGDGVTYLERAAANAILDEFNMEDVTQIVTTFTEQVQAFALPKANGAPS